MGVEQVLGMLKRGGGGTTSFEVVLTWELEVLAIVMGGTKSFHPWGRKKFYSVLRGGAKGFGPTQFSHFVAPLPVINDQSLSDSDIGTNNSVTWVMAFSSLRQGTRGIFKQQRHATSQFLKFDMRHQDPPSKAPTYGSLTTLRPSPVFEDLSRTCHVTTCTPAHALWAP